MGGRNLLAGAGGVATDRTRYRLRAGSTMGPESVPTSGAASGTGMFVGRHAVLALCLAQHLAELAGRRRPVARITRHRPPDHFAEVSWKARRTQVWHRMLSDPKELGDYLLTLAALIDRMPGSGGEQGRREAVHVGCRLRRLALQYLGSGVGRRPGDGPFGRFEAAADSGDTEVGELRFAVLGEQNVRRFDVAMQDPALVRRLQSTGHLHTDVQGVSPAERSAVLDPGAQGTARVVLHDEVRAPTGGGADVKHADYVWVSGQLSHHDLLAEESLEVVRLEVGGEDFHRHRSIQRGLKAAVYDSEAAASDLLQIRESGSYQFSRYPGGSVGLCRQRVDVRHRVASVHVAVTAAHRDRQPSIVRSQPALHRYRRLLL